MNVPPRFNLRTLRTRLPGLKGLPGLDLQVMSEWLARFSPRERQFLGVAGIALGGVLVYLLLLDPLWESYTRLQARVAAKERELSEVITLHRTYQTLRAETERTRTTTDPNFSPIAFLEGLATSTLGRDKVAAINPAERATGDGVAQEAIELRLSGVSLRELVELLYKIETTNAALRTVRLSIKKRYKDPYTFDVSLTTLAFTAR
ncbi:MAG: type II secretion system protein GspM [Candidatus Binatia bacterium]